MNFVSACQKILLNFFVIPFLWFFSYLIPKKRDLLLIGSSFGLNFSGNPKHFFLYLIANKCEFSFFWITRSKKVYNNLKKDNYPVLYLYSIAGFWNILRSNLFLIDHSSQDITGRSFILGNFRFINLWHCVPIKKICFDEGKVSLYGRVLKFFISFEFKKYIYILFPYKGAKLQFKKAFLNQPILVNSFSRDDNFFQNFNLEKMKKNEYSIDLSIFDKVILYVPTFRDGSKDFQPFSSDFLDRFNTFLCEKNYIFIIKNHPLFATSLVFDARTNIVDMSREIDDVQDFLLITDILINDYSSVCFDFMLTGRPIIYYSFDYDFYRQNCRDMYIDYYNELPGPFAKEENDLLRLLSSFDWFLNEDYREKYDLFLRRYNHYRDGKSSERLLVLINKLIKE